MTDQTSKKPSAFHVLFTRQQKKVHPSLRKQKLLKTYADDNLLTIVKLIKRWLEEDEKSRKKPDPPDFHN